MSDIPLREITLIITMREVENGFVVTEPQEEKVKMSDHEWVFTDCRKAIEHAQKALDNALTGEFFN